MVQADLRRNSVLFWLVVLIGVGIILIGARFLVAPSAGAAGFGVPVDGTPATAYLWAKGTRDVVSGLLLLMLLGMGVSRLVIAAFILIAALIPIADFVDVYLNVGSSHPSALAIHAGTAAFMLLLAARLWRKDRI